MKCIYAIFCILCCAALPAHAQKIFCGENYKRIIGEAEEAFKKGKYLDAYDRFNAARGCAEADLEYIETRQFEVLQAADAAEDRAQRNLTVAQKLIGHFNFGTEKAAWAYSEGYFGVINKLGEALSDFIYETPGDFHNGLALALTNNQYVFVSDEGQELTDRYDYAIETNTGLWRMGKMGAASYGSYIASTDWVDSRGGKNNLTVYNELTVSGIDQHYWVKKDTLWGLINNAGQLVLPHRYEQVRLFRENKAAVVLPQSSPDSTDKWGYINTKGDMIIPPVFSEATPFYMERAIVSLENPREQQLIDPGGKYLLPEHCLSLMAETDGTFWATRKDSIVVRLDNNGKVLRKTSCNILQPLGYDKFVCSRKKVVTSQRSAPDGQPVLDYHFETYLHGVADAEGNILIPPVYDYIQRADDKHVWAGSDSVMSLPGKRDEYSLFWRLLDGQGKQVDSLSGFGNISSFQNGFFIFETPDSNGYLKRRKLINPEKRYASDKWSDIQVFTPDMTWAQKSDSQKGEGKKSWELLDEHGREVYRSACEELHYSRHFGPYDMVKKNGQWTWVDTFGRTMTLGPFSLTKRKEFGLHVIRDINNREGIGNEFGSTILTPEYYTADLLSQSTCLLKKKIVVKSAEDFEDADIVYDIFHQDRMLLEETGFSFADSIGDGLYVVGYNTRASGFAPGDTPPQSLGLIDSTGKYILKPVRPNTIEAQSGTWISKIEKIGPGAFAVLSATDSTGKPLALSSPRAMYRWGVIGADGAEKQPMTFTNLPVSYFALIAAERDGKWGWIDSLGRWAQQPRFEAANVVSDTLVAVKENGRWGLANYSGKYILQPGYDSMGWYNHGLIDVKIGPYWALVDLSGKPCVQNQQQQVMQELLAPGLLRFEQGDHVGLKNVYTGREIIPPVYDAVWPLPSYSSSGYYEIKMQRREKYFLVRSGDKTGMFDDKGAQILPVQYSTIEAVNSNLLMVVPQNDAVSNISILMNYKGNVVRQVKNAYNCRPVGNYFVILTQSRNLEDYMWGALDSLGREIVPSVANYIEVASQKETYLWASIEGEYLLYDKNGKRVPGMAFDELTMLDGMNESWLVGHDGRYNILIFDKGPRMIAANTSFSVEKPFWSGAFFLAKNNNKYGVIDGKAREIIPAIYTAIREIAPETWLTEINGRFGLFSIRYGIIIPAQYEELGLLNEAFGWIRAKKNGKWGWIDRQNKVMIPFRYETASPFFQNKARVQQSPYNDVFHINRKGEMMIGGQ